MKKIVFLLVCLMAANLVLLTGCTTKDRSQTINYQGRLKKYLPSDNTVKSTINSVDLSEGPKLKYDASFGPNDLNFDIKIRNPY